MKTSESRLPQWLREATRLSQAGQPDAALRELKTGLGGALPGSGMDRSALMSGLDGVLPRVGMDSSASMAGRDGSMPRTGMDSSALMARLASRLPAADGVLSDLKTGLGSVMPAGGEARRPRTDDPRILRGTHSTASHGARDFRLVVPSDVSTGGNRPLIVMLHGCTQDADDFARGTRMDTIADEEGCFVLYPEQSSQANPQRCWNWFKHTHQSAQRGEPAILLSMIDRIIAAHPIDARRVFVAGLSAGGAMAAVLADVAPAQIAAVGIHSGLAAGAADDMPSAFAAMQGRSAATLRSSGVPTIVLHGDADSTVHADNALGIVAAVEGASSGLFRHEQVLRANGRQTTVARWSCAGGDARMEHWHIGGAGHAWSGGDPVGSYTDVKGPDASREMLRFFLGQATEARNVA